jgi:hypothetical protein
MGVAIRMPVTAASAEERRENIGAIAQHRHALGFPAPPGRSMKSLRRYGNAYGPSLRFPLTGQLRLGNLYRRHFVRHLLAELDRPLLGAVRAAMITNLEPVLGIFFAMLILDERIGLALLWCLSQFPQGKWCARRQGGGWRANLPQSETLLLNHS